MLDSKGGLHSTIHHVSNSESTSKITLISGQTEPRIQGFHSINGLDLVENHSIGISNKSSDCALCTVFDLMGGYTKPYLNVNSNGKYIRFAMTGSDNKFNIIIRRHSDGDMVIECDKENGEFEHLFRN